MKSEGSPSEAPEFPVSASPLGSFHGDPETSWGSFMFFSSPGSSLLYDGHGDLRSSTVWPLMPLAIADSSKSTTHGLVPGKIRGSFGSFHSDHSIRIIPEFGILGVQRFNASKTQILNSTLCPMHR